MARPSINGTSASCPLPNAQGPSWNAGGVEQSETVSSEHKTRTLRNSVAESGTEWKRSTSPAEALRTLERTRGGKSVVSRVQLPVGGADCSGRPHSQMRDSASWSRRIIKFKKENIKLGGDGK